MERNIFNGRFLSEPINREDDVDPSSIVTLSVLEELYGNVTFPVLQEHFGPELGDIPRLLLLDWFQSQLPD